MRDKRSRGGEARARQWPARTSSTRIVHEVTDETVTLTMEQDSLEVTAAGSKFKLFTFDPNEFPPVAPKEDGKVFKISAGELTRVSELTVYAAAKETTRYAINGLLVEVNGNKLVMVGTDGRRLAKARDDPSGQSGRTDQHDHPGPGGHDAQPADDRSGSPGYHQGYG